MAKLALPHELRASFRVPRQQAEKLVSRFKRGISFPRLLPDALKSSDAGIDSESGTGSDVTICSEQADGTIGLGCAKRDERKFNPVPLATSIIDVGSFGWRQMR
jgi:hypothetical protein